MSLQGAAPGPTGGGRRFSLDAGKALAAAAALAGSAGLLAGCTSPRNVLGPSASPCYKAVAVARLALHRAGRFAGVRPVAGTALGPALAAYHPVAPEPLDFGPKTPLCLVAYRGSYDAGRLDHVLRPGPATARAAVVVVRQRDERVVATILVDRVPRSLARVLPLH